MPLLLALGCGEDGSTEIAPPPTTLVALSPAVDTVSAGEPLDPPVSVRVENSIGDPMEGVPVRFLVASGEGRISNLAVSNGDGIAEAEFDAPSSPGSSRVRVDIPSASQVSSLHFDVVTEPASIVSLTAVEGEGQAAEVGSQLPLPFRVRASTPSGSAAGGVPVAWSLSSGDGGTRLSADTTFTDADGTAGVLLTLGDAPGTQRVVVHAVGGVASDTVSFTAEARTRLEGPVQLDSVRPLPLVAGAEARLFGSGFAADPAANEVRIEGRAAEVLEARPSELVVRVPPFDERCLPTREVGVRALVRGEPGNGEMLPLRPADPPLELDVGGAATLRGARAAGCLHLATSSEGREYRLLVQSAATSARSAASLRLLTVTGTAPEFPTFALRSDVEPDPTAARAAREAATPELRLRQAARRELERRRAFPAGRRGRRDSTVSAAVVAAPPAVGDTTEYRFAVSSDFSASCSDTTRRVRAVVRAVGDHAVLLEDVGSPPDGFSAEEWERLGSEIDDVIFPTDTAYFGAPADIDGNGRVAFLFTPEVNRLNAPGASTGIGGFFLSLDLAASGRGGGGGQVGPGGEVCPASNEAEVLYMLVPDPEGRVGDAVSIARARRNALGISAHELQHLINAERRVLSGDAGFEGLEESWLDEGLSHLAEEVVGLRMAGLDTRAELSYADLTQTREALELFNAFHINNFFQLSLYMLDPAGAPTLSTTDPGGLEGLQMRGFGWFLLRWAADQSAGDERLLFRELVGGGPRTLKGIANVERATGRGWSDLLADFSSAVAVDDAGVEDLAPRLHVTTWDFRDVFAELSRNPSAGGRFPVAFPLAVTPLDAGGQALRFELGASTSRYFGLSLPAGAPPLAVGLSSTAGEPVSESVAPQVTIVRTR